MAGITYQPLAQNSDEIRLIRIHPLEYIPLGWIPQDPIICDIFVAKLSDNPKYAALSYTWGGSSQSCEITVNGVSVNITAGLLLALQQLRGTSWQIFWVDQLCIDQLNLAERAQQVQIMAQIYSKAKDVFVSLGPDESVDPGWAVSCM